MSATQERTETLEERVARLEMRLADGFQKIGEACARGVEVENWERHWLEILREYERLSDELEAQPPARPEQAALGLGVRVDRLERIEAALVGSGGAGAEAGND
jgi:hypothetical protein